MFGQHLACEVGRGRGTNSEGSRAALSASRCGQRGTATLSDGSARPANVPVIRLHSVRHSLAFWLHSLGVPPADAAALLGHTVDVRLSVYLPESGSSGIARAASALGMSGQRAAAE